MNKTLSIREPQQLELSSAFTFHEDRLAVSEQASLQDFYTFGRHLKNFDTKMNVYKSDFLRAARSRFSKAEVTSLFMELGFANNDWTSASRLCALAPEQRRLDVLSQEHHDEICKEQMSPAEQDSWLQRAIDTKVDPGTLRANVKLWISHKRPTAWQMRGPQEIDELQGRSAPIRTVHGIMRDFRTWEEKEQAHLDEKTPLDWKNLAALLKPAALLHRRAMLEASKGGI